MATKEQPQPTNVAQPEMPMQPNAYQAYPPQYAYEDPNKGKAKMLTLEYALAMGSAIISIMLLIDIITKVFGLWTNSTSMLLRSVGGFFTPSMVTQGTGIIAASVFAVLLAVLSLVLFSHISKAIPERENYTKRTAYKLITYGGLAVLIIPAIDLVARLVSILINSLLFIGIDNGGEFYKSLYLGEFLPYALALAIVATSAYFICQIVKGRNMSKALSLVLIVASSVVLLTGVITIAIKAHDIGNSVKTIPSDYSRYKNYQDYSM